MEANKAQVADLAHTVTRFGEALRRGQERAFDPVRVGVLQFVVERERARPGRSPRSWTSSRLRSRVTCRRSGMRATWW